MDKIMATNIRNSSSLAALSGSGIPLPPKGFGSQPQGRPGPEGEASRGGPAAGEPRILKTVMVCDTQPVTAEGIRTLLAGHADLRFQQMAESLESALEQARKLAPDVIVVDKAFGIQAVLEWLNEVRMAVPNVSVVIWGVSVTEAEALRFLQAGARGILRKTAGLPSLLACLRTVAERRSWMEDAVFRDSARSDRYPRSELTAREQQVLELVEQGFKNKEIALDLGIRPGTVKIHLKHIFEKTGVRGRYGLALSGLKDRGVVSVPNAPSCPA
jgi:two-component system, NarL family, nitrate/nitrite response regulator NarL